MRGDQGEGCRREQVREVVTVQGTDQTYVVPDTEGVRKLHQGIPKVFGSLGRLPRDHQERSPSTHVVLVVDRSEHPYREVLRLERLHATGDHQNGPVGFELEFAAERGGVLGARRVEMVDVDAGRHHPHLFRRGAQAVDERRDLRRGSGNHRIGLGREERLGEQAPVGLRGVSGGQGGIFHHPKGVEALHKREAEFEGDGKRGEATDPVVRVEQVVPGSGAPYERGHRFAERVGDGGELRFRQRLECSGSQGAQCHAGEQFSDFGGAFRPCEQVNLDPLGGKRAGEVDQHHVHAAGIAASGLLCRRGVHGHHGHGLQSTGHVATVFCAHDLRPRDDTRAGRGDCRCSAPRHHL